MKFLIYFIFWGVHSEAKEFKSIFIDKKNVSAINHFCTSPFWKKNILSGQIIIDNELKTVNYDELYEQYNSISTLSTDGNDLENVDKLNSIKIKIITSIYMDLKCKYSDLIISTFTHFLDCVTLCYNLTEVNENKDEHSNFTKNILQCVASIIRIVSTLKIYIVKMIIDLMQFKKIHPNLRSTDGTLLKSLISINLFLYHTITYVTKYKPDEVLKEKGDEKYDKSDTNFEINIKIVLAQMINLVERYSSKHCYIQNAYTFDEHLERNIKDLVSKNINVYEEVYNFLINTMNHNFRIFFRYVSINYEDDITIIPIEEKFNIYDLNYLLFKDIFSIKEKYSFFPTLQVKWQDTDDWDQLINIYNKVKNTDDIKIIFDYQILLIEVIKYIYYIKFINIHINNYNGNNSEEVKLLLREFDKFIDKIIPNNYPTNVYSPIIRVRNSIYYDVHQGKHTNGKVFSDDTVIQLVKSPVIKSWGESSDIDEKIDNIVMSEFLEDITKLQFFAHFIQIFELFSYESYTLGDYYLNHGISVEKTEYSSNGIVCNTSFEQLRYNFVTFQEWLDNILQLNVDLVLNVIKPSDLLIIESMHKNILWFYKTFLYNDRLNRIFFPLIINFAKLENDDVTNVYIFNLRQNMILALNLFEFYELNNCLLLKFNREILREVKGTRIIHHGEVSRPYYSFSLLGYKDKLSKNLSEIFKTHQVNENQKAVYSTSVKEFIPEAKPICSTITKIYGSDDIIKYVIWDGFKKSINEVYNNISMTSNAMVDYQQLVRFQMFEIKWVITRVFEQLFVIILKMNEIGFNNDDHNLETILKRVRLFENLPFPEFIKSYIQISLYPYLMVLKNQDAQIKQKCKDRIRHQLKILSMSTKEYSEEYYKTKSTPYSINTLSCLLHKTIQNIKDVLKVINDNNLIDKLYDIF